MSRISAPLDRLLNIVEYLVDDTVGVIRYVTEIPREAGAPAFFHFYAEACNTRAFTGQRNFGSAGGASIDRKTSLSKAIGEAVERYCSAIYDRDELPISSAESADFAYFPPREYALYSAEQYEQRNFLYVPFHESTHVRWASTVDPMTGETWAVPAAMVFMPYAYDKSQGESPIVQSISTGLACHTSLSRAAISGICEVIERDAFTITWQARSGAPLLLPETLSDSNLDLVKRLERCHASVSLFNLTMDHGVPTILSVLQSRSVEAPALVFAASADLDPEAAARKSLEELAHTRRLAQQFRVMLEPFDPGPNFQNMVHQDDHVHLYCDPTYSYLADFLFSAKTFIDFNEIQNLSSGDPEIDLGILLRQIAQVNRRVLIADLTTPDVRELGLSVVRAIIPGFHPLFMGHANRALGGSRLWQVPQEMGHAGIKRLSGDNPAPHPYP